MTRVRRSVGLCFLLLVGLTTVAPGVVTAQQDQVTISVTLVDRNGQAVGGGVDVTATWDGSSDNATTVSNGQVLFDVPQGVDVSIQVNDDRYARNVPYTIPDAETQSVNVPVAEAGTAEVTVRNSANEPVENARVLLYRSGQFITDQRTGADGTVTTPPVEQGDYRMTILKSGYFDDQSRITVGGQTDVSQTIEQGEILLTVSVVNDSTEPPEPVAARVRIPGVGTLQTGGDGSATSSVPVNAQYNITATADGYRQVRRTVGVGESDTATTVSLAPLGDITLTAPNQVVLGQPVLLVATDADGDPVAGASVTQDGQSVGTTNASGVIEVRPESVGTVTYTVGDAATSIDVSGPGSQGSTSVADSSQLDGAGRPTPSGSPAAENAGSPFGGASLWAALLAGGVLTGGLLVGLVITRHRGQSKSTAQDPDDGDGATGESGAAADGTDTTSDSEQPDREPERAATTASGPDTPATQFAQDCGAVRAASSVDTSGPIHVYDAVRADDGESVRVLTLAPEYTDSAAANVFIDTADQWASIGHNSHIVDVHETGTEPRPWAAVAAGATPLPDAVSELDRPERLRVLDGVIEGTYTADLYNISHGNLHPGVIQIDETGERTAVIADWGLERAVGATVGTDTVSPYAAPEQLDGETTPTTDVYRVGALAYWLLTDREPYADAADVAGAIRTGDLSPPSELATLPDQIDTVLLRAMATDHTERHESISALRDAIRDAFA